MGIILGRFRKKVSTYELLEKLDSQINAIEDYGKSTELTQRKVAGRFLLVSIFVYVVTALVFYFYFFPPTVYERMLYVIPLITAPLVIISMKRLLTWWYNRKLRRNYNKLSMLKEQKKKMLDNVMETETYKVAKKILEKFAPEEVITRKSPTNLENSLALSRPTAVGLRNRGPGRTSAPSVLDSSAMANRGLRVPFALGNLPIGSTPIRAGNSNSMALSATPSLSMTATPRLPMPGKILPRDRTAFDKLVDYLVGDGPSNRYALICKQCSSHNGMVLRDELEYVSFHCCYCHSFNPSRKQRPPAPKFGVAKIPIALGTSDTSDSERNSPSDSESDTLAQITQVHEASINEEIDTITSPVETIADVPEVVETAEHAAPPMEHEDISESKDEIEAMDISGQEDQKEHEKD
ncbi:hypothetical protein HHI36_000253 [Cryptolaemus montrouzieri]|uniref:Endoplasmic reticulum junction formation protein lunapark n=1 Tax=Cryptolaemus montrouzieri TaxID=559131 RepID=A0ABD2P576_9CUCU